jgi:hypothetical protein
MSPRFGAAILLVAVVHCELYGARAPRDEWLDSQVNVLPASYPCVVIRSVSLLGNLRAGSWTDRLRDGTAMHVIDSRRNLKLAILTSAVVKIRKVVYRHGVPLITAIGTSGGVKLGADLATV